MEGKTFGGKKAAQALVRLLNERDDKEKN